MKTKKLHMYRVVLFYLSINIGTVSYMVGTWQGKAHLNVLGLIVAALGWMYSVYRERHYDVNTKYYMEQKDNRV